MKKITLLFFLIFSLKAFAFEPFVFKHFDITNGLPSTEVYQTIQDSEGYIWFATDRGVCRYDGYHFKTFTRKDGLTDEVVFGIYPEANGRVWFYTYNGGLCYYDKGHITEPDFNSKLKALLAGLRYPIIINLFIDDKQNIWIGSEFHRIFKISPDGDIQILFPDSTKYSRSKLLEIGSAGNSNIVYTGGKASSCPAEIDFFKLQDSIPHSVKLPALNSNVGFSCNRAKVLRLNNDTIIYVYGSNIYKIVNDKVVQYLTLGDDYCTLYALLRDRNGNLWIGTWRGAFCFAHADLSIKPKIFLASEPISSIWQDHEGGYWFSSLKEGAFYIPHFKVHSISKNELGNNRLAQVISSPYGIYANSMNGNLIIFPHGNYKTMKIIPDVCNYTSLGSINVWGNYVVCRKGSFKRSYFKGSVPLETCPYKYFLNSYRNDDQSDFSWSFSGNFINLISQRDDSILVSIKFPDRIRCATASKDISRVWIGLSSGLYLYTNGTITNLGEEIPQFSRRISDLDVIDDRYLLVTTRGNGLFRYDYQKNRITKLDGVPNEYCNQSYVDTKGIVWVASFSGVTRISNVTSSHPVYHQFSTNNGLISNEVYSITEFKNNIWVATGEGISWWPRDWLPEQNNPPATISRFTVNNEEYDIHSLPELNVRQNYLQFFFSAISYKKPVEYLYRLKGLHSNWIHTTDPVATYSALKPGHYVFELKSSNQETVHSSLPFTISPPFWHTTWFFLLVVSLLAIALFAILRLRYRIIRKEDKLFNLFLKAEQKALRAQINPHFLFNSFNSMLELLMHKNYQSAQTYMKRFSHLMRMILKYSRKEEIVLSDELKLLRLYLQLEKLRFGSAMHFRLDVRKLSPENTLLPSMLLQPYVENAVKHGIRSRKDEKGFLYILFTLARDRILIRIEDNGKGYKSAPNPLGKKNSFGMKINNDRIDLFNKKEPLDMTISSLYPQDKEYPGTVIEFYLPLKTKQSYETSLTQSPDY